MSTNPTEFKYLILIEPLGMMYGSAGGFLSPENLVGRAGSKFPPDAATLAGLFFSVHHDQSDAVKAELKEKLYVAGPFCSKRDNETLVYVPIPWSLVIRKDECDRWRVEYDNGNPQWTRDKENIEPEFTWQPINTWNYPAITNCSIERICKVGKPNSSFWQYNPILHPSMQKEQRTVKAEDGLFLENTVQVEPDTYLVYLSTHELKPGWYRFGGENHLVQIKCENLDGYFLKLLQEPIQKTFALITPGVWGSNRYSYRYPQNWEFGEPLLMLTDKPIPYRYSAKGQLGRGRYAIPAGSVFILERPINQPWSHWNKEWFPQNGLFKHFGSGLCLPLEIPGLLETQGVV